MRTRTVRWFLLSFVIVLAYVTALHALWLTPLTYNGPAHAGQVEEESGVNYKYNVDIRGKGKAPGLEGGLGWLNVDEPLTLEDLRGKVVILAFTTRWSGPRMGSIMPELFSLYDKYHDQGLVIIEIRLNRSRGIDSKAKLSEKIAEVKKPFWKDRDIPIPIALAPMDRVPPKPNVEAKLICPVMEDYGITGLPTGVLIDRQGRVVGQLDRGKPDDSVLEKVLKEKPVEQPAPPAREEKSPSPQSQATTPSEPTLALLTAFGKVVDPAGKPPAQISNFPVSRVEAELDR